MKSHLSSRVWSPLLLAAVALLPASYSPGQDVLQPNWFEQWVFGVNSREEAALRLQNELSLRIEWLNLHMQLKESQTAKLNLAGRGDIVEFMVQADAKRAEFGDSPITQAEVQQLWPKIAPLRSQLDAGLFGDSSKLMKVAVGQLHPEQREHYEANLKQLAEVHRRMLVSYALVTIDNQVPLLAEQRERLFTLLYEHGPTVQPNAANPGRRSLPHLPYWIGEAAIEDAQLLEFLDAAQLAEFRRIYPSRKPPPANRVAPPAAGLLRLGPAIAAGVERMAAAAAGAKQAVEKDKKAPAEKVPAEKEAPEQADGAQGKNFVPGNRYLTDEKTIAPEPAATDGTPASPPEEPAAEATPTDGDS
jgi:hypothetical protein